ncbi:hypothetical protein PAPYR_5475 [Paratrimastix pyriformis]|uniref:Uncharacterized protein n=1 Tax=Paratrimastix pyriformis TaxID=342808 RepID=A0ABQ8UHJ7_9EUKA|nr:hypothetical protein PAPYR_5475 [Paratrimastix pyriformis]
MEQYPFDQIIAPYKHYEFCAEMSQHIESVIAYYIRLNRYNEFSISSEELDFLSNNYVTRRKIYKLHLKFTSYHATSEIIL